MKIGIVTTENLLEEEFTVYQQLKVIAYIKDLKGQHLKKMKEIRKFKERNKQGSNEEDLTSGLIDESLMRNLRKERSERFFEESNNTNLFSEYDPSLQSSEMGKEAYIEVKISKYLKKFNLSDFQNTKISHLSEGVKKKLSIAMAFINNPKLLFLDEPTSVIDAISRKEIWNFIKEYK